ncbi:alpha/beta fold hydrolase [Amycolatopsis orientalis]|nr:alpha/beta fold hydrolase [Amycolatopsis orientalis]
MAITSSDYLLEPPRTSLLGLTLPGLLAARAASAPAALAATTGDRHWTFRQWQVETDTLVAGLQRRGVRPGSVVAARLPNSWEFLTLHTAVAAAGAVLVPLHTAYGKAEVDSLLDRVTPELFVDQQVWSQVLADGQGCSARPVEVDPSSPLLVVPSSGTTSNRPKLCLHSHDGLLSNAAAVAADASVDGSDVVLSAGAFSHLFGLSALHVSLVVGAGQALLPAWDVAHFATLAAAAGATALYAVPAQVADLITRQAELAQVRLRSVRTAGAATPPKLRDDVRRTLGAELIVQWGMSEVGAGTFTRTEDPDVSGYVGKPIDGAQVRVVEGELQFRGSSLFHGYLGEPEITEVAITADGWLRTGDLARLEPDGGVVCLGRSSELINVGGRKFAVREVEDLLAELDLGRIAVVGKADDRLGEYPCLVVEQPGVELDDVAGALRAAGLAEYKIPLEVVTVDEIPTTPTGKLRRKLLANLIATTPDNASRPAPVPDPLTLVRTCAARVLGRTDLIAPGTTFHDYGFDSADAIRFSIELSRAGGRSLPTSVAFDHPTPLALANRLRVGERSELPEDFEQVYRLLTDTNPTAAASLLLAAARLREVFTEDEAATSEVQCLAEGPDSPMVICFPPILPLSAPTDYAEFAEELAGAHTVYALENPGYTVGQRLPADLAALAAAHERAVTGLVDGGRPYVLCGHSSGGWIAQLVATRLGERPPVGVVLLDSPWPAPEVFREEFPVVLNIAVDRERSLGVSAVGMTRLSATGSYLRLLREWASPALSVPILYVSAEDSPFDWSPAQPHSRTVVPGHHMTMLRPAARAISDWLGRQPNQGVPVGRVPTATCAPAGD